MSRQTGRATCPTPRSLCRTSSFKLQFSLELSRRRPLFPFDHHLRTKSSPLCAHRKCSRKAGASSTRSRTLSTTVRLPLCRRSTRAFSHAWTPVNKLKSANASKWDAQSAFDTEKDKTKFRQYEEACDRVKAFYKEQHGARVCFLARVINTLLTILTDREANHGI